MTNTYLTGNPLGSTSPKDLYDNTSNFDDFSLSPSPSFTDRLGKRRETIAGMEAAFANFLQASGSVYVGEYAAGVTLTRRNQYVVRDGVAYRPDIATPMPLVLTGDWAIDQPKLLAFDSDALLRADLASSDETLGAHLIKWKGDFLDELLPTWPEQFGAVGDGSADDGPAVRAWLSSLPEFSTVSGKPGSTYRVVDGFSINVRGTCLRNTRFIYPATSADYFHCARLIANDCTFEGNIIETPAGLSRGATGFGVLIGNGVSNSKVLGNYLSRIALAGVWVSGATDFVIENNDVFFPVADGIHVSDGCRNGIIRGNIVKGCGDDAIAVVGDTPALQPPLNVLIQDNIVDGTIAGHGIALVACNTVIAKGNILRATGNAAIGSYFWQLTSAAVAKDWANDCLIEGNFIASPGGAPGAGNVDGVTGILCGAFRNSEIRGNVVSAPGSESVGLSSCIRVTAYQGLVIEDNTFKDSPSYGIWNPEVNGNGAANCANLTVRNNYFQNIVKQPIRLNNSGGLGATKILRNDFYQCAYDGATVDLIFVTKTAANLLAISGNVNLDSNEGYTVDTATCQNVYASDNSPDIILPYSPGPSPTAGAWGNSSSSGSYFMRGRTIFFKMQVTLISKGSGTGLKFFVPKPFAAGGFGSFNGREMSLSGSMLSAIQVAGNALQVQTYNNGDPLPGNGANAEVSGWYAGTN